MAAVYALAARAPALQSLEGQTLDWRFRLRGPLAPGPETVLLLIDDRSLDSLGRWPPSRHDLARAVEALAADGARVIALDLLLTEQGAPGNGAAGPEDGDRALAEAIAAAGNVVVPFAFAVTPAETNVEGMPPALARAAYRVVQAPGGASAGPALRAAGVLAPAPAIAAAAAATAHVTVVLEADGSLRHEAPALAFAEAYYPSLAVEVARLYRGLGRDELALRLGEGLVFGGRVLASDAALRWPVNYYGPDGTIESHSFVDLLDGRLPAGSFAGRVVLIGSAVLGIRDAFVTPYSPRLSGAEYFATVIDNILHDRFLRRGDLVLALDLLAILLGGLAAAALAAMLPPVSAALGAVVLLAVWAALAQLAFQLGNLWLNGLFPAAAMVLNFACFSVLRARSERRLRGRAERQRANLARYLPGALAETLAEDDRPRESARSQQAAVMFVDMVGFTRLTEDMAPDAAMALSSAPSTATPGSSTSSWATAPWPASACPSPPPPTPSTPSPRPATWSPRSPAGP
jgi:adenylate cyclase